MSTAIGKLCSIWCSIEGKLLNPLAPIADLVARLYLAKVFFLSGYNKIMDWDTTLYLFEEEYRVPLLSPHLAALSGTAGELVLSVMLALGLLTRFSALGLFFLNIVAVVSYYHVLSGLQAAINDHLQWGILLALVMFLPVQKITLDHLVLKRVLGCG